MENGSGAVKKLFRNLENSLSSIKYEKEDRAFIPHITIGRSKKGADISDRVAGIKFEITSHVGRVVLYSSELDAAGPVYTKVYERELGTGSGE